MIHQYRLNGYNIVLDVNSGSVHCVDDVSYDIIRLFCEIKEAQDREVTAADRDRITEEMVGKYGAGAPGASADAEHGEDAPVTREDIEGIFDEIEDLQRQGSLFSEDLFAPHPELLKPRKPYVKALCLHVAHTCNLSCSYCFASQGNFHGERAVMSAETARAALDFLVRESGDHHVQSFYLKVNLQK